MKTNPESNSPNQDQEPVGEPGGKFEKYKEMLGDSRAIFVLSMGDRKVNIDGENEYRPTSYGDTDIRGFMGGGHAIVSATAEIAQHFPEIKIITTTNEGVEKPTIAETYAKKLGALGVPEEQIEMEEKSTNTLTELFEMVKMAKENGWGDVAIMTNENHVERVQAMLDHLEELAERLSKTDTKFFEAWEYFEKGRRLQIHLLSAEKILPIKDPRYQKIIDAMKASDLYKKRIEAERKGTQQIKDGTYGGKN